MLVREWKGKLERVTILEKGFAWNGRTYGSLSQIAKAIAGTSWNGHRFFGLRPAGDRRSGGRLGDQVRKDTCAASGLCGRICLAESTP